MVILSGTLTAFEDTNGSLTPDIEPVILLQGWTVFLDADADGFLDAGEVAVTTDVNGVYTFDTTSTDYTIGTGTYQVTILTPEGFSPLDSINNTDPNNVYSTYVVPSFPTNVNGDNYYLVSFSQFQGEDVIFLGGVNFEDAADKGLSDNTFLTSTNQVWEQDAGLSFYRDDNLDLIADTNRFMKLEDQGGLIGRDNAASHQPAFVNDYNTGPFDLAGRPDIVEYDTESPFETDAILGNWFITGGGLYEEATIPALLIQYTNPTAAASGRIWDIDTTDDRALRREHEQWTVEWFNADGDLLGSQTSPIGESVWVRDADINTIRQRYINAGITNPDGSTPYSNVAANGLDTDTNGDGIVDADVYAGWSFNYGSLDAQDWQWSFSRQTADVTTVRIRYSGTKGLNGDAQSVGLAFDDFEAYTVTGTADFQLTRDGSINPQETPGINLEKHTNGVDADEPTGPIIRVGDTATFTYYVTNIGDVPLSNISVLDDNGTPENSGDDFFATFTGGDINNDGILDLTETWTYTASRIVTEGQYTNLGTVTGTPTTGGLPPVTDTDPSNHFGANPSIDIEKYTNGVDADVPTGPIIAEGDIATFTYVVTNTGNVDLTNVVVVDDNGTSLITSDDFNPVFNANSDINSDGILSVGESWTYQYDHVVTEGQYTNIGTVTATPVPTIPGVPSVTDSDPSNHFGQGDNNNGGQGLTIGAWKQYYQNRNKGGKNAEKYQATWVASGWEPSDLYEDALMLPQGSLQNAFSAGKYAEIAGFDGQAGISLIDALNASGNAENRENFLRQSTAGFLNASNPDISYEYGVSKVKGFAQSVFAFPTSLTDSQINALATDLDVANNAGNVNLW